MYVKKIIKTFFNPYVVNVHTVDVQHRRLNGLNNSLCELCKSPEKQPDLRLASAIKQTMYFFNFHFKYEEELMRNTAFPDFEKHRQTHNKFFKNFLDQVRFYESGERFIPEQFIGFLNDWKSSHYAVDMEMGMFLKEKARLQHAVGP